MSWILRSKKKFDKTWIGNLRNFNIMCIFLIRFRFNCCELGMLFINTHLWRHKLMEFKNNNNTGFCKKGVFGFVIDILKTIFIPEQNWLEISKFFCKIWFSYKNHKPLRYFFRKAFFSSASIVYIFPDFDPECCLSVD